MQMARRIMVFVFVLFAVIAPIALVSVGIIHAQAMRENASFMGSTGAHMNQGNYGTRDENMSSHMNVTTHMGGNMYSMHEDMHSQLNMTEHMQAMYEEGNMAAPHMEDNHGDCHD